MKKLVTNNNDLLEIIEENGIKTVCGDRMDILISDADAEKIAAIVAEKAPAATMDYSIEEIEIPRKDYKELILFENYKEYKHTLVEGEEPITFKEYVESAAQNDPYFWGWLFDDGYIEECPNEEVFKSFLNELSED